MTDLAKTERADLRVDLILKVESEHMFASAASKDARGGEHWRCKCGESYKGDGAIKKGRRHTASEIIAALDEAGVTH